MYLHIIHTIYFLFGFSVWRQGLTMLSRLALNSHVAQAGLKLVAILLPQGLEL